MTSRERRTYFDRLCALREAYAHLDADECAGTTSIGDAIDAAELELERIAVETDGQPAADPAASTENPV